MKTNPNQANPRKTKMPNYQNGKIYTIRSHQTEEFYIGSTTQPLADRFGNHAAQFKRYQNGKGKYYTSFKILEYDDAYYELYESCPCNDKNELTRREGELIRANANCVNKNIAGRTVKQYYQDNTDYYKQYYQDNAEHIKDYYKQYRQYNADKIKVHRNQKHNCHCGGKYTQANQAKHLKTKTHQKYLEALP